MPGTRESTPADFGAINKLSQSLTGHYDRDDLAFDRLQRILDLRTDQIWVFEQDQQILGWIHVFVTQRVTVDAFAEIGGLVVSPAHRRRGIGLSLVEQAKIWAQGKNLTLRVRCNTERDEALAFYESKGFKKLKIQQVFETG